MRMSRVNSVGKEVCSICGVPIEYEDRQDTNPPKNVTKHKDWCRQVGENIFDYFDGTFARIFNVIELALDENRANKAKGLIGGIISDTREYTFSTIRDYMNK